MRVLAYPADNYGCGHHRILWPVEVLQRAGHDIQVIQAQDRNVRIHFDRHDEVVEVEVDNDVDVLVFQRTTDARLVKAIHWLRERGRTVVIDIDDDLAAIDPRNPAFHMLDPNRAKHEIDTLIQLRQMNPQLRQQEIDRRAPTYTHSWHHLADACRVASLVTVSTPGLLRRYAQHGRGVVFSNYVPEHYLTETERHDNSAVVWPAAFHSHPGDPDAVGNALARLTAEGIKFGVTGHNNTGVKEAFGLRADPFYLNDVDVFSWHKAISYIGIGIVPLADTRFNASKCIDANTLITTRHGVMPLYAIREGSEVWHNGVWHKVIALQPDVARPGYEITTKRGHRLRVTPEHRLRSQGIWRTAAQLRVGDQLDLEPESIDQTVYQVRPWPADSRRTRAVEKFDPRAFWTQIDGPQVVVNETWGRFLGLFTGDGCVGSKGRIGISFDSRDQDLIQQTQTDLQNMGLASSLTIKGGGTALWFSSMACMRFLELLGVVKQTTGGSFQRTYRVPEVIWQSPRSVIAAFLAGLFEADGSGTNAINLCSKSETLAREIQRLLTAYGILSTLRRRDVQLSYVKHDGTRDYTSWHVTILAREADRFVTEIGMLSERKQGRLLATRKRRAAGGSHGHGKIETWDDEIISVEPVWIQPIDVQVDGEVFSVAGVVSHNSWLKGVELAATGVPFVASPRADYVRLNKLGIGQLADKPRDWYRKLRALLDSPDLRAEESARNRALVVEHLRLEDNAERLWQAWESAYRLDHQLVGALPGGQLK